MEASFFGGSFVSMAKIDRCIYCQKVMADHMYIVHSLPLSNYILNLISIWSELLAVIAANKFDVSWKLCENLV